MLVVLPTPWQAVNTLLLPLQRYLSACLPLEWEGTGRRAVAEGQESIYRASVWQPEPLDSPPCCCCLQAPCG